MTFVDRIANARDIYQVFDLLTDFIIELHRSGAIEQIPRIVRPGRINTADDLSYWFNLLSDEIKRRDAAEEKIPDVMLALHAVLETALQRLRGDWYH